MLFLIAGYVGAPELHGHGSKVDSGSRRGGATDTIDLGVSREQLQIQYSTTSASAAIASAKAEETPTMRIIVYDFVCLPEVTKIRMRNQVAGIYRLAGVELEWAGCTTSIGQTSGFKGCSGYEQRSSVLLRILPEAWKGLKPDVSGVAVWEARIANVFWDRVQMQAAFLRVPASNMLPYIIAHEIGHLLLGPGSHALTGIMTARWGTRDFLDIVQRESGFEADQSRQIQSEVRKRMAHDGSRSQTLAEQ